MSDLFEEKAQDWDVNEMVRNLSSSIGSAIVTNIDFNESMQVMDFGAGTGLISAHVAPLVNSITAVDTSQAMLDQLSAKQELAGKVETRCHNILEQPLDKQFDVIMSAMAMHHVDDTVKMIQRFSEHLKPGAKVALADLDSEDGSFHPPEAEGVFHSGFDRKAFQEILENNGFKDVSFVTALTVNKPDKSYPVFLALATKH
ncbi:MAG: methyltransferase domain-containing protein [Gammaproteobacteria bacterium]|nr:methyltransferase domain-containing protein [Gammaproteobacteria bacterium]